MPEPKVPWIAIDFDGLTTKVAFKKGKKKKPTEIEFYGAFYVDEESGGVPRVCEDYSKLSRKEIKKLVSLKPNDILENAKITFPGTGFDSYAEDLLKILLVHIREVCKTKYLFKPVEAAVFLRQKRDKLYEKLEKNALLAGFSDVYYRCKPVVLATSARAKRPVEKARRIVLCDLNRNGLEMNVLKLSGRGAKLAEERKSVDSSSRGLDRFLKIFFDKTLRDVAKAGDEDSVEHWNAYETAFSIAMFDIFQNEFIGSKKRAKKGDDESAAPEKFEIAVAGKKIVLPRRVVARAAKKASERFAKRIDAFVDRYLRRLQRKGKTIAKDEFSVILTGCGAKLPGFLRQTRRRFPTTRVFCVGGRGSASAGVEYLKNLPLPSKPKNRKEAEYANLYRRATAGDEKAYGKLAFCYATGRGVAQMPEEAFYWYAKAARGNDPRALYVLGKCYGNGWGTILDPEREKKFYLEAAELGYAKAQYKIGLNYLKYSSGGMDSDAARHWFALAAKNGNERARLALEKLEDGKDSLETIRKRLRFVKTNSELRDGAIGALTATAILGCGGANMLANFNSAPARAISFATLALALGYAIYGCFLATNYWSRRGEKD